MTKELICLFCVSFLSRYTPVFFYFAYPPFHNTLPSFLFCVPSLSQYTPVFFILHTLPFTIHSRLFFILCTLPFTIHSRLFYFTYPPFHNTLPSFFILCTLPFTIHSSFTFQPRSAQVKYWPRTIPSSSKKLKKINLKRNFEICWWSLFQFHRSVYLETVARQSVKPPHCVRVQTSAQDCPN